MDYVSAEYDLLDPISKSQDSTVYLARKKGDNCRYLIKVLADSAERPGLNRELRFRREIDIISSFEHPGIVRPIETISDAKTCAAVYKYSEGLTLRQLLSRKETLTPVEAVSVAVQLLDALAYIHARGVVHCDINPNNVLVSDEMRVRLLDFGLALDVEDFSRSRAGSIFGTPPYMSPEQMGAMDCRIDQRADLYCVALLLYELLSGALPFDTADDSVLELLNAVLKTEARPIPGLSKELNAIMLKGLCGAPEERYQTAAGFRHDLMRILKRLNGEEDDGEVHVGEMDKVAAVGDLRVFVSRDAEIDILFRALDRLEKSKKPASLLVYGASGMGKTEIVKEFLNKAAKRTVSALPVKCNRFTPTQPYAVLRRLCLEFLNSFSGLPKKKRSESLKAIESRLGDMSGVICRVVPELRRLFTSVRAVEEVEREKEFDRVVHVMSCTLELLCSFSPTVVFVDDLQWIDRISLEVLTKLLAQKAKLLLVATYRTDAKNALYVHGIDLRSHGRFSLMHIPPFTAQEVEDLLSARFSKSKPVTALAQRLHDMTDGAPFTLHEAIRYLVNNGVIYKDGGAWKVRDEHFQALPAKFDPVSLVLEKISTLSRSEKLYLEWCSLAEGGFEPALIEKVGGFSRDQSVQHTKRLSSLGLIFPRFNKGYAFCHDRAQESICEGIPVDARFGMYEQLGSVYAQNGDEQGAFLFNAAECFLKSKNVRQSIIACCRAAEFATSNIAFDIAIHYYQAAFLMARTCPRLGIETPVDISRTQIAFANVLALSGRHQQALKVSLELLATCDSLSRRELLELRYAIGSLYHNMGDFQKAITFFIQAAKDLRIAIPQNKWSTIGLLFCEAAKQLFFSAGGRAFWPKSSSPEKLLSIRILNKLSYSLYFIDMIPGLYAHLRALNLAEGVVDCFEKAEVYATHIVPAFQLFLKKRSKAFSEKSINISKSVNRRDVLAYAFCFSGIARYFAAQWHDALQISKESIRNYGQIGHFWDRITPLENIGWVHEKVGAFKESLVCFEEEIELCKRCNDSRGLLNALSTRAYIQQICGAADSQAYEEIAATKLKLDDSLVHTIVDKYIAKSFLLTNKLSDAHDLLVQCMQTVREKSLSQEYVASIYTDYCELLVREYHARESGNASLELGDKELMRRLLRTTYKALWVGLQYRAHMGGALRALGWYYILHKRNKRGRFFMLSAVRRHHALGMRYEEAKSLRDYALALERGSVPGEAADVYGAAYRLFVKCGAYAEMEAIAEKVDQDIVKAEALAMAPDKKETSLITGDLNDLRIDTLLEMSASMTEIDSIQGLLRQVLNALVRATGAQYGYLLIEEHTGIKPHKLAVNFKGKKISSKKVHVPTGIVEEMREHKSLMYIRDCSADSRFDAAEDISAAVKSVLCVPLLRKHDYFGCIYLGNDIVAGLFSENERKAAQILAAQAGVLLENAYLMDQHKKLNDDLQRRIDEQVQDIREKNRDLRESNNRLITSEHMKTLLTGALVHDIKNHAAGIEGNVRILARRVDNDEKVKRNLAAVVGSCEDIISLSSNMLDIGKMEEGKLEVKREILRIRDIFGMYSKLRQNPMFDEKEISVSVYVPDKTLTLKADRYLLDRVLQNLFSNAAKYVPDKGEIQLSVENTGNGALVCLYTSGAPIPDEHKKSLFGKYSRLDTGRSQYSKGLGLFFCKMVAEAHGGKIWLDTDESGNYFKIAFIHQQENQVVDEVGNAVTARAPNASLA